MTLLFLSPKPPRVGTSLRGKEANKWEVRVRPIESFKSQETESKEEKTFTSAATQAFTLSA